MYVIAFIVNVKNMPETPFFETQHINIVNSHASKLLEYLLFIAVSVLFVITIIVCDNTYNSMYSDEILSLHIDTISMGLPIMCFKIKGIFSKL